MLVLERDICGVLGFQLSITLPQTIVRRIVNALLHKHRPEWRSKQAQLKEAARIVWYFFLGFCFFLKKNIWLTKFKFLKNKIFIKKF